jgi:hypothetical protein
MLGYRPWTGRRPHYKLISIRAGIFRPRLITKSGWFVSVVSFAARARVRYISRTRDISCACNITAHAQDVIAGLVRGVPHKEKKDELSSERNIGEAAKQVIRDMEADPRVDAYTNYRSAEPFLAGLFPHKKKPRR